MITPFRFKALWKGDLELVERVERASFVDGPLLAETLEKYRINAVYKAEVILDTDDRSRIDGGVAGWFLWHRADWGIRLDRIAIDPLYRHRGLGGLVIDKLIRAVFEGDSVRAFVDERNVDAQLWLRDMKFRCVAQMPSTNPDEESALYDFERIANEFDK